MPQRPLRIGLAGFGRLARNYYLPALRNREDARLVAVADPLPSSRTAASRQLSSAEIFDDHRTMLDRSALDGVLVASPPSSHLEIWNEAAGRGLAVFMEKPFVLAGQLADVRRDADPRLMLDLNRRFWPAFRSVGERVRGGTLGRPVRVEYALHVDVSSWSTVTEHRLSGSDGGILHDLGSHAIDLAADILGEEPLTVGATLSAERWQDDHLRLELSFPDGSTAVNDLVYETRTFERLSVHGPQGRLELADPNMALHFVPAGGRRGLGAIVVDAGVFLYRALRRDRTMSRSTVAAALAAFLRALADGEPFSPGFDEAVRNVEWLEAAARSAAGGGRVVAST